MKVVFLLQESFSRTQWSDVGTSAWLNVGVFSTMEKAKAFAPATAEWHDRGRLYSEASHVYRPNTIFAPAWADYRILPSTLDPER